MVLEVGGMESPTPFAEASPLDFKIWASLNLRCLSILEYAPVNKHIRDQSQTQSLWHEKVDKSYTKKK